MASGPEVCTAGRHSAQGTSPMIGGCVTVEAGSAASIGYQARPVRSPITGE